MRKVSGKELHEILERHQHWVKEDCDDWENMRADLRGANLYGANLYGANLYGADLYGANLCEANMREADLCGADLREANLREADLCGADLYGANLYGANLYEANMRGANLCEADLRGANLYGADLCEANLREADLCGADLCGADLREAKNVPFIPYACPDFGMFIGFKKANVNSGKKVIVVLEIPEDAKRLSATDRKCRCDKAKVLQIQNLDGTDAETNVAFSNYDSRFTYTVGETVSVDDFDEDRWNECSTGIHFFINRQEAVDY